MLFCRKGILENKKVIVDFRWGDKLFVIEEVPAKVCNESIRDVGALLTYELNSGGIVKSKG